MAYTDDDRWNHWQATLDAAGRDLVVLVLDRAVWTTVGRMLRENEAIEHHSVVVDWLGRVYSTTQAVGIRRQRDRRGKPASLGHLIDDIARHPHVLTRARHLDETMLGQDVESAAGFWPRYAVPDGSHFDGRIAAGDLVRLDDACASVKKYVDKRVAHLDRDVVTTPPTITYGDLHSAIDTLGGLLRRYMWLLRRVHLAVVGMPVGWSWLSMFATPWLPSGFTPPDEWTVLDVPPLPDDGNPGSV